jgi:hypothetical protein
MPRLGAVLPLALALAGCSGPQTRDEESAAGAADTLIETCAAGRPAAVLELLTSPAKEAFTSAPSTVGGCLDLLGLPAGTDLDRTRVVSTDANDLSATAALRAPGGRVSRLQLEKSRGTWLVTHPAG